MNKLPIINAEKPLDFDFTSLLNFAAPIYLDNNATTKIDDDASSAILKMLEIDYANPSGMHKAGRIAQEYISKARLDISNFLGCLSSEIVFTSGATEGIVTAINSSINTQKKKHIISCVTEHSATLNTLKHLEENGYIISLLEVDRNGCFKIDDLNKLINDNTALVTLMAANNETGTIHKNIDSAVAIAHKYNALFHLDAVQVAGKLHLKPYIDMSIDFLTISGHKLHGPKGVGVLYIKNNTPFQPTIIGGSQENGRRAGTENVPGIVAIGVIAKKNPCFRDTVYKLHEKFITALSLKIPSVIINGGGVPGTINVGFKYVHREAMVVKLSLNGVYASVGSACAKGIESSHVLKAMKVPQEYINGSVRFSMSKYTTEEEIDKAVGIIVNTYNDIRKLSIGIIS